MRLNPYLLLFGLTRCVATIDEGLITGGAGATPSTSTESGGGGSGGTASTSSGGSGGEGGSVVIPGSSRILFTDLTHVPRAPGYLAIYGHGFGSTQGASRVVVGGLDVVDHVVWGDRELRVEISPESPIGAASVVVHVDGDGVSNASDVTITDAEVYFVDPVGDDNGGEGSEGDPFETITFCAEMLGPGGVCYVRAGTFTEGVGPFALTLSGSENQAAPKAIVAYPGEIARLESDAGGGVLLCDASAGDCTDEGVWTLAGLQLEVLTSAIVLPDAGRGTRLVGNQISCGSSTTDVSCLSFQGTTRNITLLGNRIVGESVAPSTMPLMAFEAGSRALDVGWNELSGVTVRKGLVLAGVGDVRIHDNVFFDLGFRGLELAAQEAPNVIVNNVLHNSGDGSSDAACLAVESSSVTEPVQILHNTLHECNGDALLIAGSLAELHNNVLSQPDAGSFIRVVGFLTPLVGANNFFDGTGMIPSALDDSVLGASGFVSPLVGNFELSGSSGAVNIGEPVGVLFDRRGVLRDDMPDAGAYELLAP